MTEPILILYVSFRAKYLSHNDSRRGDIICGGGGTALPIIVPLRADDVSFRWRYEVVIGGASTFPPPEVAAAIPVVPLFLFRRLSR